MIYFNVKCQGIANMVITGGTGLIFKGSLFYITDYRKNQKSKKDCGHKKNEIKIL
jgi:predicted nucleic acid-binding Zn ribbon protein